MLPKVSAPRGVVALLDNFLSDWTRDGYLVAMIQKAVLTLGQLSGLQPLLEVPQSSLILQATD